MGQAAMMEGSEEMSAGFLGQHWHLLVDWLQEGRKQGLKMSLRVVIYDSARAGLLMPGLTSSCCRFAWFEPSPSVLDCLPFSGKTNTPLPLVSLKALSFFL